MSRIVFKIVGAFSATLIVLTPTLAEPPARAPQVDQLRRGMTPDEVRPFIGQPQQISRQILLRRHIEQWRVDEPFALIEWNCQRGEIPYVLQAKKLKDE
jgi:hypothetical protein